MQIVDRSISCQKNYNKTVSCKTKTGGGISPPPVNLVNVFNCKPLSAIEVTTTAAPSAAVTIATAAATAPTAVTAAPTAAISTTTATAAAAFFARASFIDGDIAALDVLSIQVLNRGLGAFGCRHRNEGKTTRTSAHTVGNEVNVSNGTHLAKQVLEVIFCHVEGKIPDKQFGVHDSTTATCCAGFRLDRCALGMAPVKN
jgi:hypothetical protein